MCSEVEWYQKSLSLSVGIQELEQPSPSFNPVVSSGKLFSMSVGEGVCPANQATTERLGDIDSEFYLYGETTYVRSEGAHPSRFSSSTLSRRLRLEICGVETVSLLRSER